MTAFIQSTGSLEPYAFTLTNSDPLTIATGDSSTQYQIESLVVAADGSGTFRLWVDADGTEVNIIPGEAMTSGDYLQLNNHPLIMKKGWALKCSASAGNVIDVTASLLKISRNANRQPGL